MSRSSGLPRKPRSLELGQQKRFEVSNASTKLAHGFFGCALAILLAFPLASLAQESSSASRQAQTDPKPAGKTGVVGVIDNADSPDQSPNSSGPPPIQELGRGGWLAAASPLHWGSLSVGSFDFSQGYDDFRSGAPGGLVGVFHTSIFGTSVVYNPRLSRTNLALQWRPQAGFVNGQFINNLSNQDASFDLTTMLSPRLSMRFQDHFSYVSAQYVFSEGLLFAAQTPSNHSVQASFLDGPGTWLTDTAAVSFDYALSPRTDLIFTPSFNYSHLINRSSAFGGAPNSSAPLVGSNEYVGNVSLNHKLSPLKRVGIFYYLNAVKFENSPSYVSYNTFGAMYSQQLSPTWFFMGSAGASTAAFNSTGPRSWTYALSADLEKRFQRSSVSIAYTRSLSLIQYAYRNFTDRVDLNYQTQLTNRVNAGLGFGYQRVNGPPLISGRYYTAKLGYRLLPTLSLLGTYVYRNQVGDSTQIFTETRNTAYITLQWDPTHHAR